LRSKSGKLEGLVSVSNTPPGAVTESYMHLQITKQSGKQLVGIRKGIEKVIKDVRFAVEDWVKMRATMSSIIEELESKPIGVSGEDAAEARELLRWAYDDNFTFLGHRDYDFNGNGKNASVSVNPKSGLGIFRTENYLRSAYDDKQLPWISTVGRAFISQGDLLMVTKTDAVSSVHRPVHMDSIGIKRYDVKGKVIGQRIFVGLFTSGAYHRSPHDIPLLRL
jgi:glutamate dehydrogenase